MITCIPWVDGLSTGPSEIGASHTLLPNLPCFLILLFLVVTLLELFNLVKSEHIGYKFLGYNFFFY